MADNGSQTRPVRTLTVKNFSVIKDATLEFGKITVLIGPQASGKSLLCKLAFFFGQIVPEAINGLVLLRMSLNDLQEVTASEFNERFPAEAWGQRDSEIIYESAEYRIALRAEFESKRCTIEFDSEFAEQYRNWRDLHGKEGSAKDAIRAFKTGAAGVSGPFHFDESIYIPTGRSFFSTPNRGFFSVSGKNLDWITKRFTGEIDWDYRSLIEPSAASSDLFPQFLEEAARVLGGRVIREDGLLLFQSEFGGPTLPFQLLSSGTLELLPLLNPLANLVFNISSNPLNVWSKSGPALAPIFVEEPELSIFPKTQYDLMRLFAWLSSEDRLNFPFAITTHSPYILTAFNNLLEAWLVADSGSDSTKKEVAGVIDERYWLDPSDFRAYSIHDGKLESIMDEETHLINGEYLDSVSDVIGSQFDELLRIGYAKA